MSLECADAYPESKAIRELADEVDAYARLWKGFCGKEGERGLVSGYKTFAEAAHEVGLDMLAESWREGVPLKALLGQI